MGHSFEQARVPEALVEIVLGVQMRRTALSLVLAGGLIMSAAVGPVAATTATVTPLTQTHAHNVSSHWTGSWTGRTNFHTEFDYGDTFYTPYDGALTSKSYSYLFSPCPGDQTTFYQLLQVWDNVGHGASLYAAQSSSSHENSGTPC
jgi:hypothetical protein